jgi:hypothetical protein
MNARGRHAGLLPLAITVGLLALAMLAVCARADRSHPIKPSSAPAGPPAATSSTRSDPARRAFQTHLPAFVIALDEWTRGSTSERERALGAGEAALLSTDTRGALGGAAFAALEKLVAAARSAATARLDDPDSADELARRVRDLNEALAAADLPFWIDSDVITSGAQRVVLVFSFSIEGVNRYRSGKVALRALHLSRLDQLNWTYRAFGFTATRRDAVVLVDMIDERLVGSLLPALVADDAAVFDVDTASSAERWLRKLTASATAVIRADLPAAARQPLDELATQLARRAALFEQFNDRLAARGIALETPSMLVLPDGYRDELAGVVEAKQLDQLAAIERRLRGTAARAQLVAARGPVLRAVEIHELQHRLDIGARLPLPKEIEALAGPLRDHKGQERQAAVHARAELSAYLAELARSDVPRMALVQLVAFVADERSWGTAESLATLVILDELSSELQITGDPFVVDRSIRRDRVADRFAALTARSPADISAAARRAWERLFRRKLPELVPVD